MSATAILRVAVAVLVVILLSLIFRLWFGESGLQNNKQLELRIEQRRLENAESAGRNRELAEYIRGLEEGSGEYEALARERFGMVKENEIFYRFIESESGENQPLTEAEANR